MECIQIAIQFIVGKNKKYIINMNQEEDWIIVNSRDLITKQIENEHKLKKLKP